MSKDDFFKEKRKDVRVPLEARIEFFVDADILRASSFDLSESGVRFSTEEPIKVRLRLHYDGQDHERVAQLVWASRKEDGRTECGLEFMVDPEEDLPSY